MTDVSPQLANLSPEQKRDLLIKLLAKKEEELPSIFPLSYGQQALWLLHEIAPESGAYNESLTICANFQMPMLQDCLQQLVDRHTVLRTVYQLEDDKPMQRVLVAQSVDFQVIDATSWNQEQVNEHLAVEVYQPIDLEHGPVFRARLLTCNDGKHILMLIFHHIMIDGWSYQVLLKELSQLYTARLAGKTLALPDLKVQYRDFVQWQEGMLSSSAGAELWAYWQKQLLPPLSTLQLPLDYPRPSMRTYSGTMYKLNLDLRLTPQLKTLALKEGVTLYTLLLAAFQVLLHRYSGQDDILVGSPINSRPQAAFENTVGYFINAVVLRGRLDNNPSFRAFLQQMQQTVLGALDHQQFPFPLLVSRLDPERDPSRSPLCDVMFAMQRVNSAVSISAESKNTTSLYGEEERRSQLQLGELAFEAVSTEFLAAKFDLVLEIFEVDETLSASLQYNTDLFHPTTITRMAENFQTLLQQIVANPDQSVKALPIVSPTELLLMQNQWSTPLADYPQSLCLHEMFEAQVERAPDAYAVSYEGENLTYRQLNERANQLAHHLRSVGVEPEVRVGVCIERSLKLVISLLAVLKAGGGYVPLDPLYPPERLNFLVTDASVQIVLSRDAIAQRFQFPLQTVLLDSEEAVIEQQPVHNLARTATPENLAYIIYTSGSSGTPKGTCVTHANVGRLFAATQEWFHFNQHDVWTLFHSFAFDFSVWELWGALLYGGKLVVVPYWVSRSSDAFYTLLETEHVTVLNQTPSAFQQLLQIDEERGVSNKLLLRFIIFGGEALTFSSLRPWFERHGDQQPRLINMYGITETTVHVTYHPLTAADANLEHSSVIGSTIPDLYVYILDATTQRVPIGVPGELYVGGAGVSRGYYNRPDLTRQRFITDPFKPEEDMRLYRTGDLARYLYDGTIEYLGRIDEQVKIRGFRIEPAEIATSLNQHPAIQESLVLLNESPSGDKRLVAYLIAASQPSPSISVLRTWLQERLPDYMIPTFFIFLEVFPLNSNGKLNRQALPLPDYQRPQLEAVYVAPQTELEHIIALTWQNVLGLDRVGREDTFFELGGDSFLLSTVHRQLCKTLQRDFPIVTLFRHTTVKSLAAFLEQKQPQSDALLEGNARASSRQAHQGRMQQLRYKYQNAQQQRGDHNG